MALFFPHAYIKERNEVFFMRKISFLLLSSALVLLASCGNGNNSSSSLSSEESISSIASSKIASSSEYSISSQSSKESAEVVSISSTTESDSNEASASSESSSDSQSEASYIGWSIDASYFGKVANGYPDPGDIDVIDESGLSFKIYAEDVQKGSGKFSADTIQVKKQTGLLYSRASMKGTLSFELYENYIEYTQTDATGYPTIYCGSSAHDTSSSALSYTPVLEDGIYSFSVEIDGYFSIVGNSSYAAYYLSISFEA